MSPTPEQFRALFDPAGVVIAGASTHPGKFGFVSLHNVLSHGYAGRVFATNLEGSPVLGLETLRSLDELPEGAADLIFVCTPKGANPDLLRTAAAKGVRAAFLTSAGYGEAGEDGRRDEAHLVALCDELGILLAGPNGQGVVSTPAQLCAQIVAPYPPAGRIGVASQSGNFVSSFMNWSCATGVGISRAVSAGNAAATGIGDYLRHYTDDPATGVGLAYVEGIPDGRAFFESVRSVAQAMPLVLVKGGATAGGARAAASHTGSLSSDDRTFDGACRQAGVTRAATVESAFEAAATFATQPLPHGNRVVVMTTAGGWGVVTADAITRDPDLDLIELPDDLREAIDEHLPPRWSRSNPVDLAGGETRDTIPKVLELIASHRDVDAVVYLGLGIQSNQARMLREGPYGTDPDVERIVAYHERQDTRFAQAAHDVSVATGKPILTATELAVAFPDNAGPATVRATGRLCYASADRAVTALGHLWRRSRYLQRRGLALDEFSPPCPTMAEPPQDETPPDRRPGRTPAERAGATPLDPERFRANVGMPMVQRQREIPGQVPIEDEPVEPIVRRRPARHRRAVSTRPIWWAAGVLGLVGLALVALGWFTEDDVDAATGPPPDLVAATPVLSARRVPELVSRPVAVRNLRAAIEPVLARTPPASCLQVREGAVPLVSSNETAQVVPASNLKIVTGAATLALLDPESRLTTRFVTDGAPTDGRVVRGNLYMIGGGDPLLSTDSYLNQQPNGRQPATQMEAVADQIVATGIREITGSVVGDDSRYDDVRIIESWPERYLTQGQSGPLSALTVNDAWSATTGPGSDPPVHAAAVLTQLLEERGVTVAGEATSGVAPEGAAPLTEVTSLTVAELVDEGLRFSDNTTMEMLVKEIGVQTSGTGSTEAGLAAIRRWIDESGLPAEGTQIVDGSGLSEENRLTCRYVSALLEQQGSDGVVANGLARPGEPGTLDDRLLEADLQGRVRAKTGTLRPVTALSGWLLTVPERNLGFSYIINTTDRQVNEADEALQADLLESMLSYPDRPDVAELSPGAPVAPGT